MHDFLIRSQTCFYSFFTQIPYCRRGQNLSSIPGKAIVDLSSYIIFLKRPSHIIAVNIENDVIQAFLPGHSFMLRDETEIVIGFFSNMIFLVISYFVRFNTGVVSGEYLRSIQYIVPAVSFEKPDHYPIEGFLFGCFLDLRHNGQSFVCGFAERVVPEVSCGHFCHAFPSFFARYQFPCQAQNTHGTVLNSKIPLTSLKC